MAAVVHDTVDVAGTLTRRDAWSNGTQTGDPAAGYTATDGRGALIAQRPLTADEVTFYAALDVANTRDANAATLRSRAAAALAANVAYLAVQSPTAAQQGAQLVVVTRECSALIRLLLDRLDSTDGS